MVRNKMIFAAILFVVTTLLLGPSLSQTPRTGMRPHSFPVQRPPRRTRAERMEQMKQAQKQAREQALKEALAARESQWRAIAPKLREVREFREQGETAVTIRNGAWITTTRTLRGDRAVEQGGTFDKPLTTTTRRFEGWSYIKPWEEEAVLSNVERACDELVALLETDNSTDEQKREKMDALRKARQEAKKESTKAQDELKKLLSLRQHALLILIGWQF